MSEIMYIHYPSPDVFFLPEVLYTKFFFFYIYIQSLCDCKGLGTFFFLTPFYICNRLKFINVCFLAPGLITFEVLNN